jgi:proline iminopeptidase
MKFQTIILGVLAVAGVGILTYRGLAVHAKLPLLQNFEETEYLNGGTYLEPTSVENGLAVYAVGSGEPVLLLPYPHAHTIEPMAQGPLADALVAIGRTVITFDVPGAYKSTREPVGDIAEMLSAAEEALDRLGIEQPVDVVGHSMSGLAALAFAIENPERTNRLVLIGSMSGFPIVLKNGLPKSAWKATESEFWKFIFLGLKVKSGFGNLADHKNLQNIMSYESLHDKTLFSPLEIQPDDKRQGVPVREMVWGGNLFQRLDFADRLSSVQAPTLILVGRFDAEAPLVCSEELNDGIAESEMVIFEKSGHYPFLEEPGKFSQMLEGFWNQ